ncbi:SBBP repeat-containing protein [Thermoactinomyces sp. DSM 45892]|uniref:DUF7948 domain-containing protein n=1 Tax=Thermoactinomyces sp. DSM 45892 TaxID=1882753 RepID=UPI00089DA243|nr:SBBP repeat-containing protein [Thermoactinomyces sp. DSM 45892]SDY49856.1 conserved repeat domain-containing protein [Thermoactinomyces sp. DSM 45892]
MTTLLESNIPQTYRKLPLYFVPNQGQIYSDIQFYGTKGGFLYSFTPKEVFLTWMECEKGSSSEFRNEEKRGYTISLNFLHPQEGSTIQGKGMREGKVNYFLGNDPSGWFTDVPTYQEVVYKKIWDQIDVVFHGDKSDFKYDFLINPGGRISDIQWIYKGVDDVSLDEEGNLHIHTRYGTLMEKKPYSYQKINGELQEVESSFRLTLDGQGQVVIGFEVTNYDSNYQLVIDPSLEYSTYLGGTSLESGEAIAIDDTGHAYVTGFTRSANFPVTPGAFQTTRMGVMDAFVTKFNSTGSALIYSTYLGGTGTETARGIAVDTAGHAYVTGFTQSANFPVTPGAFQTVSGGVQDAFITKMSPSGNALVYSSFLGGAASDDGRGVALDGSGNAYVTGNTQSANFPVTPGAFQTAFGGVRDAFITKVNSSGSALVYSSYLGGTVEDDGWGIEVDGSGNAYVTGLTQSANFPVTPGAFQTVFGGVQDAFITKLDSSGSTLVYSSYLGGAGNDDGGGIALDGSGNAYVIGSTQSANFPVTPGAFQTVFGGVQDAFITKLDPSGSSLVFSSYLGGSALEDGNGIAVDTLGRVYLTGETQSINFPITPNAFQQTLVGSRNVFVSILDPSGSSLVYSSYLGGDGAEDGNKIVIDNGGSMYIVGTTSSENFPVTAGAFQTERLGLNDAFVSKFGISANLAVEKVASSSSAVAGRRFTYTITVRNHGPDQVLSVSLSDIIPSHSTFVSFIQDSGPPAIISTPPVGGTGIVTADWPSLDSGDIATFTLVVRIKSDAPMGSALSNTSTLSSPLSSHSSTVTTTIRRQQHRARLSITKQFCTSVRVGQLVTGTFTVHNHGRSAAENVVLHVRIPAHVRVITSPQTQTSENRTPGLLFHLGTIPAGESRCALIRFIPLKVGTLWIRGMARSASSTPESVSAIVMIRVGPSSK